jgi:hypothetical protein
LRLATTTRSASVGAPEPEAALLRDPDRALHRARQDLELRRQDEVDLVRVRLRARRRGREEAERE